MHKSWLAAAVLGSALLVGCGDRAPENAQNLEETTPAVTEPAPEGAAIQPPDAAPGRPDVSPRVDGSAAPRTPGGAPAPRATTGARPAPVDAAPPRAEAPAPPAPRFREVTVPAGTALPLDLITPVSSETAQVEMPVRARLRQAVVVDGYTAIPAGAVLHGEVIGVERAGRVRGRSRLALRFTEVDLPAGREELRTNPISFEGEATKGEDATKIGGGAVGGAIVGGILGGAEGAAKGAAIGGAAGTGVVLATRGREVTLGAGANLAASLAEPFEVDAPIR
jgi:hypothetical protein